jgi:hypothetical protein
VLNLQEALRCVGAIVVTGEGARMGRLAGLYADAIEGEPVWLLVNTRRFGERCVAVPAADCELGRGHVHVPYFREEVRGAPSVHSRERLTCEYELELCQYYGLVKRALELSGRPERASTVVRVGRSPRQRGVTAPGRRQVGERPREYASS